jgi:hypothetical protein
MLIVLILCMLGMKTPHNFSLEENDDQRSTFYSRERLTQLVDFLRDNTDGQLQIDITLFASALSDSRLQAAGKLKYYTANRF